MAAKAPDKVEQYNKIMSRMAQEKEKWDNEEGEDEQDSILSNAIELALQQGKGWGPGEKEAYLEKILDDDFVPPLFCSTNAELEKTGLQEAFTSLIYDGESPTSLMLQFRKKGNEAFANGKRNQTKNMQYFRDAVNHYYEALAWALRIEPLNAGDMAVADTDDPTYNQSELDHERSTICANIALAHMQLKNWGLVREECKKALAHCATNVKAWYRLAKAHEHLQEWEQAGDAIESGLAIEGEGENADLRKLQKVLSDRINKARLQRQKRERARAERVSRVKAVWKHCQGQGITLGRVPLVTNVTDDEEDDEEHIESRWHQHLPNSGCLPFESSSGEWSWPCMFIYPSHNQSDFIERFTENEMIALRLAEVFPEPDDCENDGKTLMPWDHSNEFRCSQLAVYFEVHVNSDDALVHPENVEILRDQASAMRFYEATRALKGDEGVEMANVVRAVARKHLHEQRKAWKRKHKSLWAKPDPNPVVRVHPAVTLSEILKDKRMVVPNVSVFVNAFVLWFHT